MLDETSEWTISTPTNFGQNIFNQIERVAIASTIGNAMHMGHAINTYIKMIEFAVDDKAKREIAKLEKKYLDKINEVDEKGHYIIQRDDAGNISRENMEQLDRENLLDVFGIIQDTLFRHNMLGFVKRFDVILEPAAKTEDKAGDKTGDKHEEKAFTLTGAIGDDSRTERAGDNNMERPASPEQM